MFQMWSVIYCILNTYFDSEATFYNRFNTHVHQNFRNNFFHKDLEKLDLQVIFYLFLTLFIRG